jgi:hypothetical protein
VPDPWGRTLGVTRILADFAPEPLGVSRVVILSLLNQSRRQFPANKIQVRNKRTTCSEWIDFRIAQSEQLGHHTAWKRTRAAPVEIEFDLGKAEEVATKQLARGIRLAFRQLAVYEDSEPAEYPACDTYA